MNRVDISKMRINSSHAIHNNISSKRNVIDVSRRTSDFSEILDSAINKSGMKFSKHAASRLLERGIDLDSDSIAKLDKAMAKANNKGIKDALILMGDVAFIANVKNKTIITTVAKENLKENVFTNIDGAVVV